MSPAKKSKKPQPSKKAPSKGKSKRNAELETAEADTLKDLLKTKWKVFRVSPLHNFSVDRFRFYEKRLNEEMNWRKKMAVTYKSKFTLNEQLRLIEECTEGVQVEVIKDDSHKAYLGHLISWTTAGKGVASDSQSLPFLLVDAKEDEIQAVHRSLCKIFDCDIQPVRFSFYALITFIVRLLETPRHSEDASQGYLIMEYGVPGCEANDKIKISLCLEEAQVVLLVLMDSNDEKSKNITSTDIIREFYNKVLIHIHHVYKLDLQLAELQKIVFPDAFITADGQVKMTTYEAAISALNILGKFTPLDAVISV